MMAELRKFLPVDETEQPSTQDAALGLRHDDAAQATQLLTLALTALGKRAVVAIGHIYAVLLAGTVFWLFMEVLQAPSILQLIGAGMYAAFILAVIGLRRN